MGVYATPKTSGRRQDAAAGFSRASSTGIRCAARLSSKRLDLATGGRVRTSPLLDASRQLEDVAASRHRELDGEELLRENCEFVDGRPTSRAHARRGDLDAEVAGRVHKFDLLAEQQRLGCVCASAQRQCLLTSAREATGSQSARCWSHRTASAHYLAAALTNPWLAHRPWHSKHASARYGEGQFIGLTIAIYGDAFTAISALRC